MVKKAIRGEKCHANHRYTKTKEKAKDYCKNEKLLYNDYWDEKKLYTWPMSEKFPIKVFN